MMPFALTSYLTIGLTAVSLEPLEPNPRLWSIAYDNLRNALENKYGAASREVHTTSLLDSREINGFPSD